MKHILLILFLSAFGVQGATRYVATTGNDTNSGTIGSPYRTITKGVSATLAGDTLLVGSGNYDEVVRTIRSGTNGSPITLDGQNGASIDSVLVLHAFINLQNFHISDTNDGQLIYMDRGADNCVISNNVVDNMYVQGQKCITWNSPSVGPFGDAGSDNLVISNEFVHGKGESGGISVYGDRNVIKGNFLHDADTIDCLRIWGRTNLVVGNTFSNVVETGIPGHPDFFQNFGPTYGCKGIIIEQNRVYKLGTIPDGGMQFCMMSPADQVEMSDITFRNNLFVEIASKGTICMRNVKFHNNIFYKCGGSSALNFIVNTNATFPNFESNGAHGAEVLNNIFLGCGTGTGTNLPSSYYGWYSFDTRLTNVTADYNFVAKSNYVGVQVDTNHYSIGNPLKYNIYAFWEDHGINGGNPFFVSESAYNFHFFSSSVLYNIGIPLNSLFTVDLENTVRGATWDIGPLKATGLIDLPCYVGPKTVQAYPISTSNSICLNWPDNQYRLELNIARRLYTNRPAAWQNWTNVFTATNSMDQAGQFCDTNVTSGRNYEYRIETLITNYTCSAATLTPEFHYQYINAGTLLPLREVRGNVILLVESSLTPLAIELDRLQYDLIGDGYKIFRHNIAAVDVTAGVSWTNAVASTKALVMADYNTDTNADWHIFIVGHVPIPYSGLSSPGGHLDNYGAHPADWYYADINESPWTDFTANDSSGAFPAQHNVPGDGKFDPFNVPDAPEMRVGRVDFRNLPAFAKSEVELLRQYLDRDHAWRHKLFTVRDAGLVNSNNNAGLIYSGLPIDSHNIQSSLFGTTTSTVLGSWLVAGATPENAFLLASSFGNGEYDRDFQIGRTTDFAATNLYIAFTTMYGSYYGDWDSSMLTNAVLLAPLASGGYTLNNYYHEGLMNIDSSSMGEAVGYELFFSAAASFAGVNARYYTSGTLISNVPSKSFALPRCYVTLMGDPTLRLRVVAPPTNVIVAISGPDKMLNWTAASDSNIQGYHVYRATSPNLNNFTRLTSVPVVPTSYIDAGAAAGSYTYMVRTVKLESSLNRSYYNASQGVYATAVACH